MASHDQSEADERWFRGTDEDDAPDMEAIDNGNKVLDLMEALENSLRKQRLKTLTSDTERTDD